MKKVRGFSLVELTIVIAVVGILAVIVLPMLEAGFNSYYTARNLTTADWQGRLALSRIERDLRSLPTLANITTAATNQLSFTDFANNAVSYTLSGNNLLRNSQILASGVGSLTFGYYNATGASTGLVANVRYISVTLNITQDNSNLTFYQLIDLRNVVA